MKTKHSLLTAVAGLTLFIGNLPAQESIAPAAAPRLSYGVPQIVQLTQAGINEDTILTYIRNDGTSYGLNADQIIYLRQQGVSDKIINAMLTQPRPSTVNASLDNSYAAAATASVPPAATTYAPAAPSSTVYVIPDTQTYAYDSRYSYGGPYDHYAYNYYSYDPCYVRQFPVVSVSIGFRGGFHRGFYAGGFRGRSRY